MQVRLDEKEQLNEDVIEQKTSPQLSTIISPQQGPQAPATPSSIPILMRNLNKVYESCNAC